MGEVRIETGRLDAHMGAVKELWRANIRWLGFFPDGAFEDAFERKHVLVALDQGDACVGYLLYRTTRWDASIVHLAVSEAHLGEGLAKMLVDRLIEVTKHKLGIGLHCRRDYPANKLWPHLGFKHQRERAGRSKDAKLLTFWWFSHRDADLFGQAAKQLRESKLSAVLDMNVLIEQMDDDAPQDAPSKALRADWIHPELEQFVTDETFQEISEIEDTARRKRVHSFAMQYHTLPADRDAFGKIRVQMRSLFPERLTHRDQADLHQVAAAAAAKASFFVTDDQALLDIAERENVAGRWGLRIVRPIDIVLQLDEFKRTEEYRPARFVGSDLSFRLLGQSDLAGVLSTLHNPGMAEKRSQFRTRLDALLAEPLRYACLCVFGKGGDPLGLVARDLHPRPWDESRVPLLRVAAGPQAAALARQLVWQCLVRARSEGAQLIRVADPYAHSQIETALAKFGFLRTEEGWVKLNVTTVGSTREVAAALLALGPRAGLTPAQVHDWARLLEDSATVAEPERAFEQEHFLWPAKIATADIPAYIIPIQPQWAQELVDERLAGLFARKEELALNIEGVYYRSAGSPRIPAPARLLWYVSKGKNRGATGTMRVRACSRLEGVDVGLPKELIGRYRRLGIYEWKQVLETAGLDLGKKIMALRFGATELFPRPIRRSRLREILRAEGVKAPIQGPVRIPNRAFLTIYTEAFAPPEDHHAQDEPSLVSSPTPRSGNLLGHKDG